MSTTARGREDSFGPRPVDEKDSPAPESIPVSICVNGRVVSEEEIAREMQHHPAPTFEEARREAALALVVRELLLQEARRLAFASGDSGPERPGFESAIERLLQQEVSVPEADLDTCLRYYEQNKERFHSPDIFEASHILFPAAPDDEEARTLARERAWALLRQLEAKPESFAELAREHSACSSASDGGHLGQITNGQTAPEFEAALSRLAPGEYSRAPVATRYGYHIIKLHRREEGRQLPFSLVSEKIAEYLRSRAWNQAVHQYISILAGQADIQGIDLEGATSPLVQ